jgi:arylsulfatase A-like enzyme
MIQISRRQFMKNISVCAVGSLAVGSILSSCSIVKKRFNRKRPNFVILFADDMGFGDWSRGGHPTIRTPNLNRMADEGVQLTQFYTANPVCSPSRSALLTGRNPIRTGVIRVFGPDNTMGLSRSETTIAEALKPLGYDTACIGKWHLGDRPEYMPTNRGFDYYYGIPYSNDMGIMKNGVFGPPLMRNLDIIEHPAEQSTLTKRYTEEAIRFIESSRETPFFLYLPYTMPHRPLFASEKFLDTSLRGLYGDVIEELDWSVGEILNTLDRLHLSEDTLVIFTSDNGPWHILKQNGGSAGLLRGAKGNTWEGGMREPFIARWPGRIPAEQVSVEVGSVLDFFPTCVKLAGGILPTDRPLDGVDLMPVLEGSRSPERIIYFYSGPELTAVRMGKWKLHLAYFDKEKVPDKKRGRWVRPEYPLLYDLEEDPSEKYDVATDHPVIVSKLMRVAETYKAEIERRGENKDLLDWFMDGWFKERKSRRKKRIQTKKETMIGRRS